MEKFIRVRVGEKYWLTDTGKDYYYTCKYVSDDIFVLRDDTLGQEFSCGLRGFSHGNLRNLPKTKKFYTHTILKEVGTRSFITSTVSLRPGYRGEGKVIHTAVHDLPRNYTTTPPQMDKFKTVTELADKVFAKKRGTKY